MTAADLPPKRILTAAYAAPMDQPMIRDGAVAIAGQWIVAVGPIREIKKAHPDAFEIDCGNSILLPGLINAHVHLDLTGTPRPPGPITFDRWVTHLVSAAQGQIDPAYWIDKAAAGCAQSIRFGVTAVGDICGRFTRQLRLGLQDQPLNITSYGEVIGMAQRRNLIDSILAAATDQTAIGRNIRMGISPHAPYSIEADGYRRCLQAAQANHLPLATHLAELPFEAEFLANHSGPLRDLWDSLGGWDEHVPTFQGGPIRYAHSLGLLDYPTLLAHVNYCDDEELAILAKGKASVVYCPRTHEYFGHPPHRWQDMLAAGINVALGTDSTASSPDLNLVDDLRVVHRQNPDLPADLLWQLITTRAAQAIQDSSAGALTPGNRADIAAFPANTSDPLLAILENKSLPTKVWTHGVELA